MPRAMTSLHREHLEIWKTWIGPVVSCFQTSSSDSSLKMRMRIGERFGMFLCEINESSCGGNSLFALVGN
jgi:hypothetical protein